MADLENSSELLRQSLDELRKTGMLTTATLSKLNQATAKAANSTTDLGTASKEAADNVNNFDKKLVSAVRHLTDAGNAIRDNREDFRSLNPAIRASGIALGAAGRKLGDTVSGVGDAVSGISSFFGKRGLIGVIIGQGVSGLGKAIGASSDAAAQLAVQFGEFATGELQKVVEAYRQVGSVGAISAGGMTQLYDQSIAAGLSIGQFAKLVSQNSEILAKSTGSTAEGAKVLSQLAQVGATTERQFLALGISFEQQRDFQAKFLEQNRLTGRIQTGDTRALTEASKAYIFQLDELSRITGLSREQAAKLLDEQNKNIRFRASVRIAEGQFGPEVAKAMRDSVAVISSASKDFGTGFADLMGPGGASTEAAKNLQVATGGAAKGIADMVRTGQMTADQGAAAIQKAVQDKLAGLGGDQFLGLTGGVEGPMQNLLLGMDDIARSTNLTVEAQKKAREEGQAARDAQDKNTQQVIDAQMALQKFAIELDKLVKEKILPTAATAVKTFTQTLLASVDYINQKLGINPGGTGGGGAGRGKGSVPPGGAVSGSRAGGGDTKPADAGTAKSKIKQLESGGRNIGTGLGGGTSSAFGLYQMTRTTFNSLERQAKDGSPLKGKTFEQMRQDTALQEVAMDALMAANQAQLANASVSTKDAAIYMAHVLGAGTATKILKASDAVNIDDLVSPLAKRNNPNLFKGVSTAGDIKRNFDRVTGGGGYQYGGIASGPRSGYMSMLHGTEAVIPLPGGRSVPVEMTGMSDKISEQVGMMGAQLDRLDEMVSLMRTSNDTNTKILRAAQN